MKRTLSRTRILRQALDLVEKEGLDRLTMRRLADRLGVGTMSLYNHISGKEELTDGIVDQMLREVELPPAAGAAPGKRLRRVAHSLRDAAHRHPEIFRLIALRPPPPALLTFLDIEVETLRQLGFTRRRAAQALRILLGYVFGYIRLETAGFFSGFEAMDGLTEKGDYPSVADLHPYLTNWDSDKEFDLGLSALLAGLQEETPGTEPPLNSPAAAATAR